MKKSRFTESQIVAMLKEHEHGKKVGDICREHGIADQTFYNWKAKYGGMDVNELRRVKDLECNPSLISDWIKMDRTHKSNQQRRKTRFAEIGRAHV